MVPKMGGAAEKPAPGRNHYVVVFLALLVCLLAAVGLLILAARSTLPQAEEIIDAAEVADLIRHGEVERLLVQDGQDLFVYLPGRDRPLYSRLALGVTITATLEGHGIPSDLFPPIAVETD